MSACKTFVSWSGGKDSAFAYYKIVQSKDSEINYFLNMISQNGKKSRTHGISSELLRQQAKAIGVSIIQRKATWKTYEKNFKKLLWDLEKEGVHNGIFGDIDFQVHRDWIERVCKETGIKPEFPLWGKPRLEILREFIKAGFETVVVAVKADCLGKEWLGRRVNEEFIKDLNNLSRKVDLCGEEGEYHTFVIDGPIFKKEIKILKTKKIKRGEYYFWDILDYEIN